MGISLLFTKIIHVLLNGRKKIPKRRARAIYSVAMTIGRNHLFGHTFKDAAHVFWLLAEVGTYTRGRNRLPSGNLATLHVGSPCVEEPLSYT